MELNGPTPKNSDLLALGMCDYSLRAIRFDPPVGNRGVERGMKPVEWSCTITSTDASRPTVRAIRDDPDDADRSARLLYRSVFGKDAKTAKLSLNPISDNPNRASKTKPKPAKPVELDDEASSLL